MLAQTRIANVIDTIEYDKDLIAKLDEACKKLLANKMILAWILKGCMKEYENYTVQEIAEKYIEGEPEVGAVAVHQDEEVHLLLWSYDFSTVW